MGLGIFFFRSYSFLFIMIVWLYTLSWGCLGIKVFWCCRTIGVILRRVFRYSVLVKLEIDGSIGYRAVGEG